MKYSNKPTVTFSTDMGNVSHTVPSIHPMLLGMEHKLIITMVTNTPSAHYAAKAVAMTTINVLTTLKQIKAKF